MMLAVGALVGHYITRVTEWRVMTDELLYLKLARSMADSQMPLPEVHGEHVAVYSILYSLIIAPFVGLLRAPAAFEAIRVVNVVVMVSTAIPAYLLARQAAVSRAGGLVAATLSVLVPWMAQATSLMTEVAGYPAYVWSLVAITRAIAEPSVRRDVVALAAIAVACLARTQFFVLLLAFPIAALVHEIGRQLSGDPTVRLVSRVARGARDASRKHAVVTVIALGGLILVLFASSVVLGSYAVTVSQGSVVPSGILGSAVEHLAYITVGVGALPVVFAAAFGLGTIGRPVDADSHALASVVVVAVAATTLAVASFDLRFTVGGYAQERYLFYICPLLFAGAVAWLAAPARSLVATATAALGIAGVVLARSYDPDRPLAALASPNRYFFRVLDGRLRQLESHLGTTAVGPEIVIAVSCLVVTALAVTVLRRGANSLGLAVFGLAVGGFLSAQLIYVLPRVVDEHNGGTQKLFGSAPLAARDWVDDRISTVSGAVEGPINSRSGVPFFNPYVDRATWWELEFWNRSVDRVYRLGTHGGEDLTIGPIRTLSLDFATGAMKASGGSPPHHLIVASSDVRFAPEFRERPVSHGDMTLYRTPVPYRADWASQGIAQDGWTEAGRPAVVRVYARRGQAAELRRLRILLHGGADIGGPRRYTLSGAGPARSRIVRDTVDEQVDVCVPRGGHVDVALNVHGRTALGPRRVVGLRVLSINTRPLGRTCRAT